VPYARARSGLPIFGDAGAWWTKSAGLYTHGATPVLGAVMVLTGYAGPGRAHLAVVASQVSDREITVDHANWLDDGAIYRDDPVVDVSPANDWSEVRVYNARAQAWGTRTYVVQGFIGPGRDSDDQRVAAN
jgi:surface antigen